MSCRPRYNTSIRHHAIFDLESLAQSMPYLKGDDIDPVLTARQVGIKRM